MNIKLLRSFLVLADCLHYGEAAQRLCLTQPALTKQIRQLESDLGGPLFVRGRHGTALTGLGRYLRDEGGDLLRRSEALTSRARQAARGEAGRLAIGFGLSSIELAPRWVAAFRRQYPQVEVSLEDMSSAEQVARLLAGTLQLGFVRLPVAPPLACRALLTDQLALATADPALACTTPAAVAAAPLIALLPQRGPGLAGQVAQWFAGHGLHAEAAQQTSDIQTVLALVAAGTGVAIVPRSAARIAPPDVRLLPLPGGECGWQVGMAWHPGRDEPARDRFVALVTAG
ncbi:LysR family transcriptional regulator [Chitiniphilus shinanonensis]|uniref:LysR family transcriptional regulator n=2 Tax=Chitiniphilus shinanonensis TaxID=553088 RepID=UPI000363AF9D|nr:LysR family transcriptional regulator [Chitiniphilus shinanonensis]